ncbi:MAG: SDR family NAD(P)-dependent oxidoreductase, partial [Gammaproteobacteria bacterium]
TTPATVMPATVMPATVIPATVSPVTVIIGAGSGIGRALCLAAAADGPVYALAREPARLGFPESVRLLAVDASDPAALFAAAAQVQAEVARVHRLIVCTGVLDDDGVSPPLHPEKALRQLDRAPFLHAMAVNAFAPLAALNAFASCLRHTEGARVAVLSAMVGSIGDNQLGGWYSYRMSKAALNMGVHNVALEWGRQRHAPIVVALHPGTTLTPLSERHVGPERARPAADSAAAILALLNSLTPACNGQFLNWDGRPLPW